MAFALTATLDEPRLAAHLVVSEIPATADFISIYRTAPSGAVVGVRGAVTVPVSGTGFVARDYELPFDVPITYTAVASTEAATEVGSVSVPFTIVYGKCEPWLVDIARPTNSGPVLIESMRELGFDTLAAVHRVLGRRAPVVTSLPAWTPSTELILLTDTEAERDQLRTLLGSGYPFLLRATPEIGIGNMYLSLTGFAEERFLAPGAAPERRFVSACVQVERPDPDVFVPAPPNTYANVKATYATYADLKAEVGTYDVLAYLWPDDPALSPVPPWLPDDV